MMQQRRRHAQRGASMVEFAIAASCMLMLLFGIIQFGQVMYTYHTVSNGARLGARWAIVRGSGCTSPVPDCNATQAEIQSYVQSVSPNLNSSLLTVTVSWTSSANPSAACGAGGTNAPGNSVCVTVSYPFSFAVPLVSTQTLTLSSTSKMVISE
jgi:Flp pilus assembly protein TadG